MNQYNAEEKRRAIERELDYRRYVYPKRVLAGRMTQRQADKQIRIFEEIAGDYTAAEVKERLL